MTKEVLIQIAGLEKSYFSSGIETRVLKHIDLEIYRGEFVSIIGPSGAGKSTLLYQMSLLDRPTKGRITINDQVVSKYSETKSTLFRLNNCGYVFQDYALIPDLSAAENVMMPYLMRGHSKEEAYAKALEILTQLELAHVAGNLPNQLSGGQQQRVSVARAVVHEPVVLFADEPTASLDTERSREVLDLFESLNKKGQTIIMVTHELEFARRADRIIEIVDGQVHKDEYIP